jgi:hypothetical protein
MNQPLDLDQIEAAARNAARIGSGIHPDTALTLAAEIRRLRAELATTRSEVLRESAEIAESLRQFERTTGPRTAAQVSENVGILRVADELRSRAAAVSAAARP